MMILSQAAPFDMATTSGIAQSVTLRFVDSAGAAKDISGHEFRCAVRGPGAAAIKCEPVDANTALLSWSPLKAGTHAYDLFMTSPDGAERPLIKGEIQAASRVTPPGSEDVVTIGDVKIMIPDAAEGEVKIIDPSVDAAERAESAAQEASNARNDAQNAKKEAEKSAERAATSATASANSATAAANALAAMPQVDASGNMTLAGGLTAAGAINANGGINIPLAVGAATDMSAVNFFYAMGLAGAVQALIQPLYLKTSSMPVVGAGTTSVQYAGLYATSSTSAASGSPAHSTTTFTFEGPQGQHNYSSFAGFSIPLSGSTASKFTFGLGRGSKTVRGGLTMDSFSMIPGNNLAVNYGEIIDITTTAVRDAVRGGYVLRVREIYYVSSGDSWQVKTTESFIPATQNHPFPACLNRLIFMQEGLSSMSSYEGKASLYIELGGGQTNTLFKIAALRGVSGFEDGMGFSTLVADVENPNSWTSSVRTGAGSRYLYANGLRNPMYAALEAMAVNAIESEETADFVDVNTPLES